VLHGVRVLDRTTEIAGPYCTKLLADAGAEVVKVEPPDGDPLRRWRSGALFTFLNMSKRSLDDATVGEADADVLVVDAPVDLDALWSANPALVVVTITPYGCDGPWVGRPSTEFTLQAWAGATGSRGYPDGPPTAVGGRLGEWVAGTYAAVGALAALRAARRSGRGAHVDVALLDSIAVTMAMMPSIFASMSGWHPLVWSTRSIEVPSIEPTADGYACFTTNSAQQFSDFCLMIGHAELLEEQPDIARPGVRFGRRDEFNALVHAYTANRTTEQVLEDAAVFRIPSGPTLNGATVSSFPQFVERGVFEQHDGFIAPRIPYRISPPQSPPADVARANDVTVRQGLPGQTESSAGRGKPLGDLRVVDCTAWWAGPAAGHALACLGADVIKVESITRPDLVRYAGVKPPTHDQWWEWGPMFHGANGGKRGITLDLTRPEGVAVFERLVATADLVIENYTPRVMEQFGLGWERLHEVNPQLVMVRMPAFGLDGPWRDHTGFAQTMESVTGMAWVTGFPDGAPVLVRGACDPLAGMHAVIATMIALEERDHRGEGVMVEATMVEAALNAAAEQVIEWSATGTVITREGNRGRGASPQGVYRCAGEDRWVAIAVVTDAQWNAVRTIAGLTVDRSAHDDLDDALSTWCHDRDADDVAEQLIAAGVPAGVVIAPRDVVHNPQLRHRGLFEMEHHPITGDNELLSLPFLLDGKPTWAGRPSPSLGEHNVEVLTELGLSADEIAELEADGIIGTRPTGL
jgi:crotonobetainyl-CoA:carnitine CoA-transferase CaiB-like acyl-CoA transferase